MLNFISTRAVLAVENLVLSSQDGYRASEVSLPKIVTILANELPVVQSPQRGTDTGPVYPSPNDKPKEFK